MPLGGELGLEEVMDLTQDSHTLCVCVCIVRYVDYVCKLTV